MELYHEIWNGLRPVWSQKPQLWLRCYRGRTLQSFWQHERPETLLAQCMFEVALDDC